MLFKPSLLAAALLAATASAAPTANTTTISTGNSSSNGSITILLGSYTSSIFTLDFTPPTTVEAGDGKLVRGFSLTAGLNPSWVFLHPTLENIVYAAQENTNGSVIVGRLSEGGKKLEVLGETSTGGSFPAHAVVSKDGSTLLAANYGSGSAIAIPLDSNGLFLNSTVNATSDGTSPYLYTFPFVPTTTPLRDVTRQEASHPHQLIEVGSDREFLVNDLGQDKIWKLKLVGEGASLTWELVVGLELTGDEGGGPRHALVSNDTTNIYVLNELFPVLTHSQIPSFNASSNSSTQPTTLVSKTSVLPPPALNPLPQNTTAASAELLLINTLPLKTIVASTRRIVDRPSDALAFFDLKEDGGIELKQFAFPRQGKEFRAVGATEDGKWVVAAGQTDGWVSVFGQTTNGTWIEVVQDQIQLESPTHVLFI
ncbi:Lactonase, 7-bladed beta-propeller-domain-containing protein [Mrakia frigida]|uniref:lactonase family protein n=1 Tax=Mrakia frigida TaxID=29902 RepID=UPI003FCC16CF